MNCRRDNDSGIFYVFINDAFVSVEICVPSVCTVFNRVLQNADAGQSGLIEWSVVGTAKPAALRTWCAENAQIGKRRDGFA